MNQPQEVDYLKIYNVSNPLYVHPASLKAILEKVSRPDMQYLESLIEQGIIKIVDES